MFFARVTGQVWGSRKWQSLEGLRLLVVRPYAMDDLAAGRPPELSAAAVVVADVLGAGPGEDVVVAYGHAARSALESLVGAELPTHPIDAAVVAIVDNYQVGTASTKHEAER